MQQGVKVGLQPREAPAGPFSPAYLRPWTGTGQFPTPLNNAKVSF